MFNFVSSSFVIFVLIVPMNFFLSSFSINRIQSRNLIIKPVIGQQFMRKKLDHNIAAAAIQPVTLLDPCEKYGDDFA